MNPLPLLLRAIQLSSTALGALPALAQAPDARPAGGQVSAGSATIAQTAGRTTITQGSDRAIIDWRGFDVGRDHAVRFDQPSARALALNRIASGEPSRIAGGISANGGVIIINQAGVVFTGTARVDAASVIVSTADIANDRFMAGGRMVFDRPGRADARIVNEGSITAREAGIAALVAPEVANRGTISARLGSVVLAGAETHTLDLHGDGLFAFDVTGAVRRAPSGGGALVTNTGVIEAEGGRVLLTARAADGVVTELVRAGGRISANTDAATGRRGDVVISGTGGAVVIEGRPAPRDPRSPAPPPAPCEAEPRARHDARRPAPARRRARRRPSRPAPDPPPAHPPGSCRLGRIEFGLDLRDLVAQPQASLLHAPQGEVIGGRFAPRTVDQAVEVGVFDAQFDQPAR